MKLTNRLSEYVRACFTGIWIESHEHQDALTEIAQLCLDQQWQLATWDIESGLNVPGQTEQDASSNDPLTAIRSINALATPEGTAILVLQNFHRFRDQVLLSPGGSAGSAIEAGRSECGSGGRHCVRGHGSSADLGQWKVFVCQ